MNNPHYLIQRPHLLLGIILVVLALIFLALAAAQVWERNRPIDDFLPRIIASPEENEKPNETP